MWDTPAAEREFKKAIALNPGSAEVLFQYGYFLKAMGQFEDALREFEKGRVLNPLSIFAYSQAMHLCLLLGQYDQAMGYYNKAVEINPDAVQILKRYLGIFHAMQGNYEQAIEFIKEVGHEAYLGHLYAMNGEREKAGKILNELIERNIEPFLLSYTYVGLGDYNKAFECIEKSRKNRFVAVLFIKSDFQLYPLRSDPRYEPLVKRIFYESKRESFGERKAVTIDPAIYDEYVGTYVQASRNTFTISSEKRRLFIKEKNEPIFELFPESETRFFIKESEYPFSFIKNDRGRVNRLLILSIDGEKTIYSYQKIEDE